MPRTKNCRILEFIVIFRGSVDWNLREKEWLAASKEIWKNFLQQQVYGFGTGFSAQFNESNKFVDRGYL